MGNFIYYIYVHHLFWWITGKKDTYNANFYEVPLFTTTRKPREKRQKKKTNRSRRGEEEKSNQDKKNDCRKKEMR